MSLRASLALAKAVQDGKARKAGERTGEFDPSRLCYPEQYSYVTDPAKRKVLRKTRRAGGTVGLAISYLQDARREPYANQLYVTTTLKNARRLIWPTLKKLNTLYQLGGVPNEVEASLRFPRVPNEPTIFLGGAKDAEEIDKIRGIEGGLKKAGIDEAQSMRARLLKPLIDDVIEPSLLDYDGTLEVVGTPGPVKAGYFYEIDEGKDKDAWAHFRLSLLMNPYLEKKSGKPPAQIVKELLARRKWTEANPTYRREYLGEWVTDTDALALHYDPIRNSCGWQASPEPGWNYLLVFDIGFDDADAIAVLGWPTGDRRLRLVKEVITRKQGITELGNQLRMLWDLFSPQTISGDLGALGKKIGEELRHRWELPVEAAEKSRKAEHVGLLDDALLTGTFLAPPDSTFAEDCGLVQWDQEARAQQVLKFSDDHHSDIIDAVLYGYRLAQHWSEAPLPAEQSEGERIRERVMRQMERPSYERDAEALGMHGNGDWAIED